MTGLAVHPYLILSFWALARCCCVAGLEVCACNYCRLYCSQRGGSALLAALVVRCHKLPHVPQHGSQAVLSYCCSAVEPFVIRLGRSLDSGRIISSWTGIAGSRPPRHTHINWCTRYHVLVHIYVSSLGLSHLGCWYARDWRGLCKDLSYPLQYCSPDSGTHQSNSKWFAPQTGLQY